MTREITNPNPPTKYPKLTRATEKYKRIYLRLRSLPSGSYTASDFRKIFGTNGFREAWEIEQTLNVLEARKLLTYEMWQNEDNYMQYRITLNVLPEIPDGAIDSKNEQSGVPPHIQVVRLFEKLQEKTLGTKKDALPKDYLNAKRLLDNDQLRVVLRAVKNYWEQRADARFLANFSEFYMNYTQLFNDALIDEQREIAKARELAQKNLPPETRREWLVKTIKYCKSKNLPYADYEKELEQLDDQTT